MNLCCEWQESAALIRSRCLAGLASSFSWQSRKNGVWFNQHAITLVDWFYITCSLLQCLLNPPLRIKKTWHGKRGEPENAVVFALSRQHVHFNTWVMLETVSPAVSKIYSIYSGLRHWFISTMSSKCFHLNSFQTRYVWILQILLFSCNWNVDF